MRNVTLEETKAFIQSAKKSSAYSEWSDLAKRSWYEIKRRTSDGRLLSFDLNRQRGKYPLWYNIYKVRQSIVYSRLGQPIVKDTNETGQDSIGASAAFFKERLAINLAKDDDPKDTLFACRNDLLATDFCVARGYYEKEDVKERVKERLTPQKTEQGSVVWYDQNGDVFKGDDFEQDDEGMFAYLPRTVDVTNERACVEHILYRYFYVDPDVKRWKRVRRIAFENYYSVPEFKDLFGASSYDELKIAEQREGNPDFEKQQNIKVFEYWDDYSKETKWFCDNSEKFLEPKKDYFPYEHELDENEGEVNPDRGILNLPQFWPCVKPRIRNAPTDSFWPTPEYEQFRDILLNIDNLFSRGMNIAQIIRPRLFYDDDIDGVANGLSLTSDTSVVGVPNLTKALTAAGGDLNNVAQYLDISVPAAALQTIFQELEREIATVKQMVGVNDMMQGLSADNSGKTLGERQMEQKHSLSQIEELQVMMAELDRDIHELRCDIAINNFKTESLVKYMMPETAPENHRNNFQPAIGLLKENHKRFRLDLETDSTIAINEQYDKAMRKELVDAMTTGLQGVAEMAQTKPELVQLSLETMKYYIQGFRGSKIFQEEITQTIDNVIKSIQEQAEAAKENPPFNKDEFDAQLEQQKLQQDGQLAQMKIESDQLIASAELAQNERLAGLQAQVDQMKLQADAGKAAADNQVKMQQVQADMQIAYAKMQAEISQAQQEMTIAQDKLMIEYQKVSGQQGLEEFKAMLEKQRMDFEAALAGEQQKLEQYRVQMDEQEKLMTEQRLQSEHELDKAMARVEMLSTIKEMSKPPEIPPITVHVNAPEKPDKPSKKKKFKVSRDSNGDLDSIEES